MAYKLSQNDERQIARLSKLIDKEPTISIEATTDGGAVLIIDSLSGKTYINYCSMDMLTGGTSPTGGTSLPSPYSFSSVNDDLGLFYNTTLIAKFGQNKMWFVDSSILPSGYTFNKVNNDLAIYQGTELAATIGTGGSFFTSIKTNLGSFYIGDLLSISSCGTALAVTNESTSVVSVPTHASVKRDGTDALSGRDITFGDITEIETNGSGGTSTVGYSTEFSTSTHMAFFGVSLVPKEAYVGALKYTVAIKSTGLKIVEKSTDVSLTVDSTYFYEYKVPIFCPLDTVLTITLTKADGTLLQVLNGTNNASRPYSKPKYRPYTLYDIYTDAKIDKVVDALESLTGSSRLDVLKMKNTDQLSSGGFVAMVDILGDLTQFAGAKINEYWKVGEAISNFYGLSLSAGDKIISKTNISGTPTQEQFTGTSYFVVEPSTISIASKTTLGGVMVGDGMAIDTDGLLYPKITGETFLKFNTTKALAVDVENIDVFDLKNVALLNKGNYRSPFPTSYTALSGAVKGDWWKAVTATTFGGKTFNIGDELFCITSQTGATPTDFSGFAHVPYISQVFQGATSTSGGTQGVVLAPIAGQQNDILVGGGTWSKDIVLTATSTSNKGIIYKGTKPFISDYTSDGTGKNTIIGVDSANLTNTALYNVFVGADSAKLITTGSSNIGIGYSTFSKLTTGNDNIGIGYNSLSNEISGVDNVCIGNESGKNLTSNSNTVVGSKALYMNELGDSNCIFGYKAGVYVGTTGSTPSQYNNNMILIGANARPYQENTVNETVIGSLGAIGHGSNTTTIGNSGQTTDTYLAGKVHTPNLVLTNSKSTDKNGIIYKGTTPFINDYKHTSVEGFNIFIGNSGNLTLGDTSIMVNQSSRNVFIGDNIGKSITLGYNNTSVGEGSNKSVTTGYENVTIGVSAGANITTGNGNILLGGRSGSLTTGSTNATQITNNIYIGGDITASSESSNNEICIGNGSIGRGNNTVNLGNASTTKTFLRGEILCDTTTSGFVPPKLTTIQRNAIATPTEGSMVFDTDLSSTLQFLGGAWAQIS